LSGSIGHGDGVLRAALVVLVLGWLGAVVVLVGVVSRRTTIVALVIIVMFLGAVAGIVPVLMVAMCFLGVLHVGVLVDDPHHLRDRLGVALEHLAPKLDVVHPLVEVVYNIPVINLRNRVTVSKVPLVVVAKRLVGLLGDAA
jgi:hypothetical protein